MGNENEIKRIEELLRSLKKTDIVEFRWENNGTKIDFKKGAGSEDFQDAGQAQAAMQAEEIQPGTGTQATVAEGRKQAAGDNEVKQNTIKSKMVGTFYISVPPDGPVMVKEGDEVKKGQKICVIEAMKVMREISVDSDSRITKILIDNGHPVEYNQDMFVIE